MHAANQLRLLAGFYFSPARTASRILDEGNWWAAALLAAVMCLPFAVLMSTPQAWQMLPMLASELPPEQLEALLKAQAAVHTPEHGVMAIRLASSPFQMLLLLAAFFTPALICAGTWTARQAGSLSLLIQRDFGAACTGVLMAFAASHAPLAAVGVWLVRQPVPARQAAVGLVGDVWIGSLLLFAVFTAFVAQALWGVTIAPAAVCAGAGLAAMASGVWVYPFLQPILWMFASPFLLYYAWSASQGNLLAIGNAFRGRANLRRQLEAEATNPHDADAQYQIGLLLSQRRQYPDAIQRFERAVKIDSDFAEAHFELGRVARQQNRLPEAIEYLSRAARLNDKLQLSDVWREIGATQLAAGQLNEAEMALRKFVDRRSHDPEGLYLLGEVLHQSRPAEAQEFYQRAVDAAIGAPSHLQREARHWASLAGKRRVR